MQFNITQLVIRPYIFSLIFISFLGTNYVIYNTAAQEPLEPGHAVIDLSLLRWKIMNSFFWNMK
jgi:hypothetical protein